MAAGLARALSGPGDGEAANKNDAAAAADSDHKVRAFMVYEAWPFMCP